MLGVGSGLSYGVLGATHFALEDVGILGNLPNMMIVNPADGLEAESLIEEVHKHTGPVYFRIGKKDEPKVFEEYKFDFGEGVKISKGRDIAVFVTGPLLPNTIKACEFLKSKHNINTELIHFPVLKPIDKKCIINASKNKKAVFVVDEHYINGSLGSFVSEILASSGSMPRLTILGVPQEFVRKIGSQDYLRKYFGLDIGGIVKKILDSI